MGDQTHFEDHVVECLQNLMFNKIFNFTAFTNPEHVFSLLTSHCFSLSVWPAALAVTICIGRKWEDLELDVKEFETLTDWGKVMVVLQEGSFPLRLAKFAPKTFALWEIEECFEDHVVEYSKTLNFMPFLKIGTSSDPSYVSFVLTSHCFNHRFWSAAFGGARVH